MRGCGARMMLTCAIATGCGEARTASSLEQRMLDGGAGVELGAAWRYRSGKVDVDIHVLTTQGADSCSTSATLRIDEAVSGTTHYDMPDTDCSLLRIGADGDLVLRASPTGHDWSAEAIDVDSDQDMIRLGPWRDEQSGITYRFALSSPECSDDSACECPKLERHADGAVSALEFARSCD